MSRFQGWTADAIAAYQSGQRQAQQPAHVTPAEARDALSANGLFAQQLAQAGIKYAREVGFHSTRRWRIDFVLPTAGPSIALEVNGGLFVGGRHTRGAALLDEYDKINELTLSGYRVLLTTPEHVRDGRALALVRRALEVLA